MARKKSLNKFANAAIITGISLMALAILAFLYVNGEGTVSNMVAEFRSEVFGVAAGIFIVGLIAKIWRIRLG
jgi:preprotein translocase subunit Sss1